MLKEPKLIQTTEKIVLVFSVPKDFKKTEESVVSALPKQYKNLPILFSTLTSDLKLTVELLNSKNISSADITIDSNYPKQYPIQIFYDAIDRKHKVVFEDNKEIEDRIRYIVERSKESFTYIDWLCAVLNYCYKGNMTQPLGHLENSDIMALNPDLQKYTLKQLLESIKNGFFR